VDPDEAGQFDLLNPLGHNSESDVLVSGLGVAMVAAQEDEAVSVVGVFDGLHRFECSLMTRLHLRKQAGLASGSACVGNSWSAAMQGRDGQTHVLCIKFEVRAATRALHSLTH
jgi:hypothetical protein